MKTKTSAITAMILLMVAFACISRKEIIKKFNKDGTIKVSINTYEDDTNYLHNNTINPFPMKIDRRWTTSFAKDTGKKIRCTAVRNFSSLIMLQKTFIFNNSKWEKLSHELIFKKKFRWFYSIYDYNEVFHKINPFELSTKGYISDNEIQMWMNRDDALVKNVYDKKTDSINSAINDKAENWLKACFKEELVNNLKRALEDLNDPNLRPSLIAENIDTILNLCPGDFNTKKLIAAMAGYFRDENVYKLLDTRFSFLNNTEKRYRTIIDNFYEEAVFKIIMPGKLTKTNAQKMNHDTLCWSVTAYKFFFNNYELKAKSYAANIWTFWVTGIIIAMLLVIIYVGKRPDIKDKYLKILNLHER